MLRRICCVFCSVRNGVWRRNNCSLGLPDYSSQADYCWLSVTWVSWQTVKCQSSLTWWCSFWPNHHKASFRANTRVWDRITNLLTVWQYSKDVRMFIGWDLKAFYHRLTTIIKWYFDLLFVLTFSSISTLTTMGLNCIQLWKCGCS